MRENLKKTLKDIMPPVFLRLFKKAERYGFFGNYLDWQSALKDSRGYDDPSILEKVKTALLKVKNGQAVYERDSVIFDQIEYSWPVLAGLLWIASQNQNRLCVLDFGGSLGSSYFQNRDFLKHLGSLEWNIVEQHDFVQCGKKNFQDRTLKFHYTIADCLDHSKPDVLLCSSVIQYLENPYEFLKELITHDFQYLIFDRTTFLKSTDRLTVQKVRPGIYDASYPAWFLDEEKFLKDILTRYSLVSDFESIRKEKIGLGDLSAFEKGFIFKSK